MDLTTRRTVRLVWSDVNTHQEHLYTQLSAQQASYYLVDTKLTCNTGQSIYCHRLVLARHSPFLR